MDNNGAGISGVVIFLVIGYFIPTVIAFLEESRTPRPSRR